MRKIVLFSEGLGIYRYSEKLGVSDWIADFLRKYTAPKFFEDLSPAQFNEVSTNEKVYVVGAFKDTEMGNKGMRNTNTEEWVI